ncbi:MAG TPA: alanine racemase, partial [Aggregatilineales bacterium]|nr:alanine racemase [Aggregatilineales bacterium]
LDKTGFDVRYGSARHVGKWVPLVGSHQLYVVLAAVGVGLAFEVPFDDAFAALTHLEPLPGRMRPLPGINGCLLIDDTASGSAYSLLMALKWLRAVVPRADIRETQLGQISPFGKVYVVVGELDDLDTRDGVDSFTLGERIADVASILITEGDSLAQVTRTALENGMPPQRAHMTYSPVDSAAAVQEEVGDKDVVLIAGNNTARMERVVSDLLADAADARILVRQTRSADVDWDVPGLQPTWIQVDVNVIAQNVRLLKEMLPPGTRLMAIVKANAYGHGAIPVSTTAILNGADYLGVAKPEEALVLRDAGVTAPILILSHTPPQMAAQIVEHNLTITLYDQTVARAINRAAANMNRTLPVHVRVDMGNGGMGVPFTDVAVFFRALARLNNIHVEGIYTGLSTSDWQVTQRQFASFRETVKMLRAADVAFDFAHAANSAVMLRMPDSCMDMVRCGMAIYGLAPHPDVTLPDGFQPALTWKTTIVQVKRVRMADDEDGLPGTSRTRTIAVLPVGYMEGVRNGWSHVLVNGQPAPVVEQIEAYQMLVDVSGIDDVRAGDEAVLIGVQDSQRIDVKTIAAANGVRSDEILSGIHVSTIRVK